MTNIPYTAMHVVVNAAELIINSEFRAR